MQASLRHEAAARARRAEEHRLAEESKLAMLRKEDQLAKERRLLRIKERGQKELLSLPDQRRRGRPARDQASSSVFEQNEAVKVERERKQLLGRQEDERRRQEREARDQACLEALARHDAAARIRKAQEVEDRRTAKLTEANMKDQRRRQEREARDQACLEALARHDAAARIKKAQEAEDRRMAKLKEAEHKKVLRDQEKELRRTEKLAEKQAEKQKRDSAIQAKKAEGALLRERVERQRSERSLGVAQKQAVRDLEDGVRRRDRERRDEAGRQALQRHKAALQAQKAQQKSLTDGRIVAFDGVLPSFFDEEYQYMKQASAGFLEDITSEIQMRSMKDYQRAISDASRRLLCGICGGLFQENEIMNINLQASNLQYFLQRMKTAFDYCFVKNDVVSMCTTCNLVIAKRVISLLSAGNFINCLFCQNYLKVLKNLNTVEEAFIIQAHVIGIFLKLTLGVKGGIGYRESRNYSIAVR